ncbi:hypothetical protein AJ80_00608 [Polytolypa hystricis UAMH7299]|uniref:AB hydrolase-1 domain-containing protein n=1 Tax=Polytolypa hystricis (strain UAMH7299) TaxID=1447883 RepID=A0A2B7Z1W6_POLH7|nr:hypothetical protein AJ80_00608 [Polytolypa hystricis UAMH7299]
MAPGLLFVTMQPGESLSPDEFHDWYNNEHGPTRLRLPFIENGFRYRAIDLDGAGKGLPEWLAIYDVTDMAEMKREPYLHLRRDDVKSSREKSTMAQISIDRRLFDFVETKQSDNAYVDLDNLSCSAADDRVLVVIIQTLQPGSEDEYNKWYREEHMPMLSKVPGWLRTRRFVSSAVEPTGTTQYAALHEYAPQNGLDGPELKAAISTPWRERIMATAVKDRSRRVYKHYYTFGAAPRDLNPLKNAAQFTSPDGLTKVLPASSSPATSVPAIESFVTTRDGVDIPFRLEGSSDPTAPLIVLSNSILTHYAIWDGFLAEFFANPQNHKYRVLRYLTRGRLSKCGDTSVTVDVLAADIIALLDALRVPQTAAVIGVSLGGATVLNAALKYPERVATYISCDTNAKSPGGNSKAWGERIAIAEKEGATSAANGEPVVGSQLADVTVRRWFTKETYDGGEKEALAQRVTQMVHDNSLAGFKKSVEALFSYNLVDEMKQSQAKGAFVVGSADGVLPTTMKEMVSQMGAGAEFAVIDNAGHLPMTEQPRDFERFVTKFLAQQ